MQRREHGVVDHVRAYEGAAPPELLRHELRNRLWRDVHDVIIQLHVDYIWVHRHLAIVNTFEYAGFAILLKVLIVCCMVLVGEATWNILVMPSTLTAQIQS